MSIINVAAVTQWDYVARQLNNAVSEKKAFVRNYGKTAYDMGALHGLKIALNEAKRNCVLARLGAFHNLPSYESSTTLLVAHAKHTMHRIEMSHAMSVAAKLGAKEDLKKMCKVNAS